MKSPNARVIETETLVEHGRGFIFSTGQSCYVYRRSVQLMGYWIFFVQFHRNCVLKKKETKVQVGLRPVTDQLDCIH